MSGATHCWLLRARRSLACMQTSDTYCPRSYNSSSVRGWQKWSIWHQDTQPRPRPACRHCRQEKLERVWIYWWLQRCRWSCQRDILQCSENPPTSNSSPWKPLIVLSQLRVYEDNDKKVFKQGEDHHIDRDIFYQNIPHLSTRRRHQSGHSLIIVKFREVPLPALVCMSAVSGHPSVRGDFNNDGCGN